MEGGGESMVATIKGLLDAGICVPMVNDWQEINSSNILTNQYACQTAERSCTVETNTDSLNKCSTSAQICDGHYATTYQTAHCGMRPTSPPVQLTEFPPQRSDLKAGQGNFEIVGTGLKDYTWTPKASYWSCKGLSFTDRGNTDKVSHENDDFIHSLRKYPNVLPKTLSAEMVHRLLTYTQAKNLTKSSYHTKVTRLGIGRNSGATKETRTYLSKNIQTYARKKQNGCKENGNTTDKEIKFGEATSKVKEPSNDNVTRSKNFNANFTYDYFNSRNEVPNLTGRSADVRYLSDVKRCIRDTVRQIVQERSVDCPRIMSRYSNHRRIHHRSSIDQNLNTDTNVRNTEDRASSPLIREVSISTQCETFTRNHETCTTKVNYCCICKKLLPCLCMPGPANDKKKTVLIKCACASTNLMKDKLRKEIIDRIRSIPVYADESPENKVKRERMVIKLADVLEKGITSNDMGKMRKEIDNFFNNLPMWCPESKEDQELFKNQIADKLLQDWKYFAEEFVLNRELNDWANCYLSNKDNEGELNVEDVITELQKIITSIKKSFIDKDYKEALTAAITGVFKDFSFDLDANRKYSINFLANNLANKLITQEKNRKKRFTSMNVEEDVEKDIGNAHIDDSSDIVENTDLNLVKTMKNIDPTEMTAAISKNANIIKNEGLYQTKSGINDILKEETSAQGPKPDFFADSVTDKPNVTNLKKESGLVSQLLQIKDDIKAYIKEEVIDTFNTCKVKVEDRSTVEETISNILEDEIIRGVDINKVKSDIYTLVHNLNISNEQAKYIADKLTSRAREMSLGYKSKDSAVSLSTRKQHHEKSFKKDAFQVVLSFIETLDNNNSPQFIAKVKDLSDNFIDNIAEIKSHNGFDKNALFNEALIFLDNLPIKLKKPKEKLASHLITALQNVNIHTSTPHRKVFLFRPKRGSTGSDISSINFEDVPNTQNTVISTDEDKFKKKLTKICTDWVNDLPVDFTVKGPKGFRETMINDVVADILDRQKYLQLNPLSKVSDKDELDHLKYQVFRWLHKFLNTEDLMDIMPKTETLMSRVKNITVPLLVKPVGRRKEIKLLEGKVPTYIDALQDEISVWVDEIPKNLWLLVSKSELDTAILDLVEIIQEFSTNAETKHQIMNYLKIITKDGSQNELNKITENLLNRLKKKGFMDNASWAAIQNTSEFIEENLCGALLDWLKASPLYQTRNSHEKVLQVQIITDLSKDLRKVFDNFQHIHSNVESDKVAMNEIMKQLIKFPMDVPNKIDKNYIQSIAQHLLNFIKKIPMFQGTAYPNSILMDKNLDCNIDHWIESLPATNSNNDNHFEVTKQFKNTIKRLKQQNASKKTIQEEVLKFLRAVSMQTSKKNDERYLHDKAQQLVNEIQPFVLQQDDSSDTKEIKDSMSKIESNFSPKDGAKRSADILYENIIRCCEKLPIYDGDVPEEKERIKLIKQNIASRLLSKIVELNMDPLIFNDDYIYDNLLLDEIENEFNVLPVDTELTEDLQNIKSKLFKVIKEAKEKIKNEVAGHHYKQRLTDTVTEILLPNESVSDCAEPYFQSLKEDIAEAFINLHYYGANQPLRKKFKSKINEKIDEFCSNYLKRYPSTPIDTAKLNRELYKALKEVPVPNNDCIRNEIDETMFKTELQGWMKELPLEPLNAQDKCYTNKIISIMAKRLHDIEKDKNSILNYTERLEIEILKWMKKIPLKSEVEHEVKHYAENLIKKLRNTEESSRFKPSSLQHLDTELSDSSTTSERIIPFSESFPPSSLTPDDHTLLQRIRERVMSDEPVTHHSLIGVSPTSMDAEGQTELRHYDNSTAKLDKEETSSLQAVIQIEKLPGISGTLAHTAEKSPTNNSSAEDLIKIKSTFIKRAENCGEMFPQVIVREYHWDTTEETIPTCPNRSCVNSSRSRKPQLNKQPVSCRIPPVLFPEPNISLDRSHRLSSRQNHMQQPITPNTNDSKFNQASYNEPVPAIPQSTFQYPRTPTSEPLGAGQDSTRPALNKQWSPTHFSENKAFQNTSGRRIIASQENIVHPYTVNCIDERMRCNCQTRILTKCSGSHRNTSHQHCKESLKQCRRCCGTNCPYPSHLFFRQ